MRLARFLACFGLGLALSLAQTGPALALEEDFAFFEEEAKVAIATQHEQTPEQAPSIVSVITRQDIDNYGFRDLTDILRMVPGFEFGVDVFGIAGLSSRGVWAHEGKALLMIDGMTVNELGFGNYNFFGSIPASMIEKVEIIRGPGSARYGGFAEVAAINIITHQPSSLDGMRIQSTGGALGSGEYTKSGNISFGTKKEDKEFAVNLGASSRALSRRPYHDFFGSSLGMGTEDSPRGWEHAVAQAQVKNLDVRYLHTSFDTMGQDGFFTLIPKLNGINQERANQTTDVIHLHYKGHVSDSITVEPLVEYTRGTPIVTGVLPASTLSQIYQGPGASLERLRSEIEATYDADGFGRWDFGAGYIRDSAENIGVSGDPGLYGSSNPSDFVRKRSTDSRYLLAQYLQQFHRVGVTLGGRFEDTSFGSAVAPRAGVTYVQEAFSAKILYGRAFRVPLPWQAYSRVSSVPASLEPETADTIEGEIGYKWSRGITGTLNVFYTDISRAIVYNGQTNSYNNSGDIVSYGSEGELKIRSAHYGGFVNFSFAQPGKNSVPFYLTPNKKNFLASPKFKANIGTFYKPGRWEYGPSVTLLSARYGQSQESSQTNVNGVVRYKPLALANFNIRGENVLKNMDVTLSAHNIFDSRYTLIQPYYGSHAPLPAQDREIALGVTWHF